MRFRDLANRLLEKFGRERKDLPLVHVESGDSEIVKAMEEAKETLPKFVEAFEAKPAGAEHFSIKKPFPTSKGTLEHIWIEVDKIVGGNFLGRIGNDPIDIPDMVIEQEVLVAPHEISDWMYLYEGKIVGGYTIKVMMKRGEF
jgi:uncharacterized protein YegJ (DUF2314 family)